MTVITEWRLPPLWRALHWTNLNPLHPRIILSSKIEIGPVFLKKIFWFCQWIFAVSLLSFLRKGRHPSFEKIYIPFTQEYIIKFWLKMASGSEEIFFLVLSMDFRHYHPLRRSWFFTWTNLNFLHPRMLCAKFAWN